MTNNLQWNVIGKQRVRRVISLMESSVVIPFDAIPLPAWDSIAGSENSNSNNNDDDDDNEIYEDNNNISDNASSDSNSSITENAIGNESNKKSVDNNLNTSNK